MYRLNHIHIKVTDVQKAAQWFIDNFGNRRLEEFELEGNRIIRTDLDGIPINFTQHPNAHNLPPGDAGVHLGLEHFGLETDDLDGLLERLQRNGVEITEPARPSRYGARYAFIKGPDNTRIELFQPGTK